MKTTVFKSTLIVAAVALATTTGWKAYERQYLQNHTENPLLMENVEALTNNEGGSSSWVYPDGIESGKFSCGARLANGSKCSFIVITCTGGGKGCNPRPCNIHG